MGLSRGYCGYQFLGQGHLNRHFLDFRVDRDYFILLLSRLSLDLAWKAEAQISYKMILINESSEKLRNATQQAEHKATCIAAATSKLLRAALAAAAASAAFPLTRVLLFPFIFRRKSG